MIRIIIRNVKNLFSFGLHKILRDEEGVGVVEVILILLVLVGLVIIFKDLYFKLQRFATLCLSISNKVP